MCRNFNQAGIMLVRGKVREREREIKGREGGGRRKKKDYEYTTMYPIPFSVPLFPLLPPFPGQLLSDNHQKLTEPLLQTQEFQQIADNFERCVNATRTSLKTLKAVAAQVRLIEPQIEGFKVCTCILLLRYSNEIDAL